MCVRPQDSRRTAFDYSIMGSRPEDCMAYRHVAMGSRPKNCMARGHGATISQLSQLMCAATGAGTQHSLLMHYGEQTQELHG